MTGRTREIIHGDAFKVDWDALLAGRKIDLLMLDPPYNTTSLKLDADNFNLEGLCGILHGHLSPTAWVFLWGPMEMASRMLRTYRRKFEYIWAKPRPVSKPLSALRPYMNHEILWAFVKRDLVRQSGVYFDPKVLRTAGEPYRVQRHDEPKSEQALDNKMQPANRKYQNRNWGYREGVTILPARQKGMMRGSEACDHPTLKPLFILEPVARAYCPPGGLMVDPCAGGASTLLAAINTGRDCICVEKEEKYVAIAKRRLNNIPPPVPVLRPPGQTTLDGRGGGRKPGMEPEATVQ